jgi:hypothetical protein
MPATETNRRIGVKSAVLAAFQSGKGTVLDNLAGAVNMWSSPFDANVNPIKSSDQWMSSSALNAQDERFNKVQSKPFGSFRSICTPETLAIMLRSNWGPLIAGVFTLNNQIEDWLTLAWVENRNSAEAGTVMRLADAWIHRITLEGFDGVLRANCEWAARSVEFFTSLPVTLSLPAAPMAPTGSTLFPSHPSAYRAIRDPDGDNEKFSAAALTVTIDQRLIHQWDMSDGINLRKGGQPRITVEFVTRVNDEGWGMLTRSATATKQAWRIEATSPQGATFTIDLNSAEFDFTPIGRDGRDIRVISVIGEAFIDSAGNEVEISLLT